MNQHSTIAIASVCTARAIRDYFQAGTIPKNGYAVCQPDELPFFGRLPSADGLSDEDETMLQAMMSATQSCRG